MKIKRIMAVLLAGTIVTSTCLTCFATDETTYDKNNNVTVKNDNQQSQQNNQLTNSLIKDLAINASSYLANKYIDNNSQENNNKYSNILNYSLACIKTAKNLFDSVGSFNTAYYALRDYRSRILNRLTDLEDYNIINDHMIIKERLYIQLSNIIGQDKAIKELKDQVIGILAKRDIDRQFQKSNKDGKYKTGANVIYLIGPTGSGKTMAAEAVAKALLPDGCKLCSVNNSVIFDPCNAIDAVFTGGDCGFGKRTDENGINVQSLVGRRLRNNPNTVIILNEYDKMVQSNPKFDSVLRGIIDPPHTIRVAGEDLDCSGLIIIVTSNESHNSAFIKQIPGGNNDKTGSRTSIEHEDVSFKARINPIEFSPLSKNQLKEIARDKFKNHLIEPFLKLYNIKLNIPDEFYDDLVKNIDPNEGARTITENSDADGSLISIASNIMNNDGLYNKQRSIFRRLANKLGLFKIKPRYDIITEYNVISDCGNWTIKKSGDPENVEDQSMFSEQEPLNATNALNSTYKYIDDSRSDKSDDKANTLSETKDLSNEQDKTSYESVNDHDTKQFQEEIKTQTETSEECENIQIISSSAFKHYK